MNITNAWWLAYDHLYLAIYEMELELQGRRTLFHYQLDWNGLTN